MIGGTINLRGVDLLWGRRLLRSLDQGKHYGTLLNGEGVEADYLAVGGITPALLQAKAATLGGGEGCDGHSEGSL